MEPRGPTHLEELIAQAAGLRRLAVRLVGESDADDVLQDAVIAGMDHAPGDPRALRPWLAHVVRNFAAGRHRNDGRRKAREVDVARREALPSASDMVERMEVQRIVAEEVLRLDEPYRATVLALHFEGVGAEEYARSLGVPGATVRSWSKRGLDALRTRIDRRFGGDRKAWSACLLPLARTEAAAAAIVVGGGFVMKKMIAACLVLVLALSVAHWWGTGQTTDLPREPARELVLADAPSPELSAPPVLETVGRREASEPAAAASTPAVASADVSGRVTWTPHGVPAVDVGVRLIPAWFVEGPAPTQAVTDAEGRYRFADVAPGFYQLRLDRANASTTCVVRAGEHVERNIASPRGNDITGRVLYADGTPAPGAEVHVRESNSRWSRQVAVADASGVYRVESADSFTALFARAPGHSPSGLRQAARDAGPTLDLYLGGVPGHVTGRVLDAAGGAVEGAFVEIASTGGMGVDRDGNRLLGGTTRELSTRVDGTFVARDLEPGPKLIHVLARGGPVVEVVAVVRTGVESTVVVHLPALARVRGRITGADGNALEGVRIHADSQEEPRASTQTGSDAEGRYDLGSVPAGPVRLVANYENGVAARLDVELDSGTDFEWSPKVGAFRAIRGRLVDLAGAPLADRVVELSIGKGRPTRTDDEGRFVFEDLKEKVYSISHVQGFERARAENVQPGDDIVLVVEQASARIVGRLTDARGSALQDIGLSCDRSKVVYSGEDGSFELVKVRSGPRGIEMRVSNLEGFILASVDVRPGALHDVGTIIVPGTGSLHVRARSEEGVPIGWARPTLRRVGQGDPYITQRGWGADGTWTVHNLPAGEYQLGVRDGGAAQQVRTVTVIEDEETKVDLDVRFGAAVEVEVGISQGARGLHAVDIDVHDSEGQLVGSMSSSTTYPGPTSSAIFTLAPGSYRIDVRTPDGRSGSATVQVGSLDQQIPRVVIEVR